MHLEKYSLNLFKLLFVLRLNLSISWPSLFFLLYNYLFGVFPSCLSLLKILLLLRFSFVILYIAKNADKIAPLGDYHVFSPCEQNKNINN